MVRRVILALLVAVLAATAVPAHRSVETTPDTTYRPSLILAHREGLEVDEGQAAALEALAAELAAAVAPIYERIAAASEALLAMFDGGTMDESAARAAIDRLLELERQVKRLELMHLVRVKNVLRAEQQERLVELVRSRHAVGEEE